MTVGTRVLVADDQRDVLTALELLLKAEGMKAVAVTSPEAIVAAVERESFDAVLMDLNYTRDTTSGAEGLDVLARLARIPNAPPVIVMTAWGSIELAVEAMRRGAVDFVTKPWDNRELLSTLERNGRKAAVRYSANELEVAAQVQRKLWPKAGVALETFSVAGHCRPVGAVGGDTFDFIPLEASGGGAVAFSLADVSGKGLPAALMMASLQALLRSAVGPGSSDLKECLEVANRHFFESTEPQHYATLFFGVYSGSTRELRYVSCAHPAAILSRADGGILRLTSTSTAFGMFETLSPGIETVALRPNDTLLVFSDGILEAERADGSELGEERFAQIARELMESSTGPLRDLPERLVHRVLEELGYQQTDDVTVVAARCSG